MRIPIRILWVYFLILISANSSWARVFSMNDRTFGSYFHLSGGTSLIGNKVFANESVVTDYSKSYSLNAGGEFGFMSTTGPLTYRFGIEIIKPTALVDVAATQSGTQRYLVKNDINAVIPKIALEFDAKIYPNSRYFIFATMGTASLTFQNDYTSVTIAPTVDHSVKAKSSATMNSAGIGAEYSMLDTTTFMMEVGYRTLSFTELKYSADVTSFGATAGTSAAHVTGDVVKDTTATNRKVDMTGTFATIGFRFWLL